jgi:hypothetical protein
MASAPPNSSFILKHLFTLMALLATGGVAGLALAAELF